MTPMRYELKYYLTDEAYHRLMPWLEPYVEKDVHVPQGQNHYTVCTIYFDTQDLEFYFEKLAGVHTRKKIRIRSYNGHSKAVFLEIKRKHGNAVGKERVPVRFRHVEPILNSRRLYEVLPSASVEDQQIIGKFLHTIKAKSLRPSVMVAYEREALVGCHDDRLRVTFDKNVRSVLCPTFDELFSDYKLVSWLDSLMILELKFNGPMPPWLRRVVWQLGLRPQAISKYCMSVDACCNGDWARALSLLRTHRGEYNGI